MGSKYDIEPSVALLEHFSAFFLCSTTLLAYISTQDEKHCKFICRQTEAGSEIEKVDFRGIELSNVLNVRNKGSKNVTTSWKNELGVGILDTSQQKQPTIYSENDRNVLCLCYNSDYHHDLQDVFYIQFSNDLGSLNLQLGNQQLNTKNKPLIATLMYRSGVSFLESYKRQLAVSVSINDNAQNIIHRLQEDRDGWKLQVKELQSKNKELADKILEKISNDKGCYFSFADECYDVLKNYSNDITRLKKVLQTAADYVYQRALYTSHTRSDKAVKQQLYVIEKEYLQLGQSDISTATKNEPVAAAAVDEPNKNARNRITVDKYLEELQEAVKKTIANGQKPTGRNVAANHRRKITEQAVCRYLKDHAKEINTIHAADTTRFAIMKQYFTPYNNVLRKSIKVAVG